MASKMINGYPHKLLEYDTPSVEAVLKSSREYLTRMQKRRSIRAFSSQPVPREAIENILLTASSAPSGANKQPWTFCAVSNKKIKSAIREAAEKEEYESYNGRMSDQWLEDLKPIGTDWHKPFLETAPWVIVVFKKAYDMITSGEKLNNYYVNESVGIACGFLISAIHQAGLVTLTHTPSPMNFLSKILMRPENERPFLLLPIGYPEEGIYVPDITKKEIDEVSVFYE